MPNLSQLPNGSAPSGTELLWALQAGNDVALTVNQILSIAAKGVYSPTFGSGYLQYTGSGQSLNASPNFIVGTNLPNPTGIPGPAFLLGSGGGSGIPVTACLIQDQAFDNVTPGNTLIITAGETQAAGTARGGLLWLIGGGSFGGTGGELLLQGGTSLNGAGGLAVLQGGNATNGGGAAGDVHVIAGEVGSVGANVHLTSTSLNGVAGVIRMSNGSDISHTNIMADFIPFGVASGGAQPMQIYLYGAGAGGFGSGGAPLVSGGSTGQIEWFQSGFSGSINFGTGHTMTVVNGLITGYT